MPLPVLVIGNKNYSSWSMRPWLALRTAGIPFEERPVSLYRPEGKAEILRVSPTGKVPVLIEGEAMTFESLAICERAAEIAPAAGLWPADPAARSHARSISCEMHAGFVALRTLLPCNLRARGRRELTADAAADLARVTTIWCETRERYGRGGDFLFGRFGIADAMFAPVVTRLRSWGIPFDPSARAYAEAVLDSPPFREWEAAALAEAERVAAYEP
ncbi:glutathione S-transferase [Myxococcaceae bacterium]|jgi:glutathione S-transferase|nr:glutathione S-transferase [Myxococcaceae bacterium]